jgi:hypothetical protein
MAKKKSSVLRWLKIVALLIAAYLCAFVVMSRWRQISTRSDSRMWSFFEMPMMNPLAVPDWKRRERIAAAIFWPCIQLEERWTNRRYWPAAANDPTRLL